MRASRNLVWLLLALFMLNAMLADAATQAYPLRIRVLSAEYRALNSETPVPKDCDLQNFSAYCNESKNPSGVNKMVVQDSDGKSFTITCTVDSRWSKCTALPVGEMFEARMEKHGITVVYSDGKGKEQKQFYQVIAAVAPPQSVAAANSQPAVAAAALRSSSAPAPASPVGSAQQVLPEKVRCNFSSTPSGAEITLDGRYMGNTPSEIGLTTGTHVILLSMPGFARWKRELTVVTGSELNVSASLQKTQP
jgi:PEGA domain